VSLTTTRPEPAAQTGGAGRNPKPRRDVEVAVNDNYAAFLAGRAQYADGSGFDADFLPNYLFDFQRALVQWAVRQGRGAVFADCGLGKTVVELVWAENIRRRAGKPVLIVTPLAVAHQIQREADKFGIDAEVSRDGSVPAPITITNYEQLEKFDRNRFAGVVCDESSAIKAFDGKRRAIVTEFLRTLPYRLLATATAAPNDYIELGTSSEALGQLGHMDMLNRFFVNDQRTSATNRMRGQVAKWRFKGHAEAPFWRWIASWARAMRKPSDLGFDDGGFILDFGGPRPTITVLCGSTRFKDEINQVNARLTLEGQLVISLGVFGHTDMSDQDWTTDGSDLKRLLDDLHKRKIDLADEVYVVNSNGYIGDSTRSEIEYARKVGKPVRYLTEPAL